MARNGGKDKFEQDIDALFTLPLAEFTSARNTLAARLKKEKRSDDAERVKLLPKPSISAWAVNQLYWEHRDAFDELIATGKRLRPHAVRGGGKVPGMRDSLDARRDALIQLSDLAADVLRDAGHNPSQDTIRRIVTTLEAISAHALLPDGPTPGRLTHDIDPPTFASLASLMSGPRTVAEIDEPVTPARKSGTVSSKATTTAEVRRIEEFRQAKITAAKASLQDAKRSLNNARARAQGLEATQKKVRAELKQAEKYRSEVEELLEKATSAYEGVAERVEAVEADVQGAAEAVEDAKRAVEQTTKELESLLRK